MKDQQGKLCRSLDNKILFGLCAGISKQLHINLTWLRLVVFFASLDYPIIVFLYIILSLSLQEEVGDYLADSRISNLAKFFVDIKNESIKLVQKIQKTMPNASELSISYGTILIVIALFLFVKNVFGLVNLEQIVIVPLALLMIGTTLIFSKNKKG